MEINVTHLTSVHPRYDTRIFLKMCSSLSKNKNYHVTLVVADGFEDEIINNVKIVDVGKELGGRISRMTKTVKKVFEKAKSLDSDIYHLHDPELIPIGLKLKKMGKKVIFDAHEDLPKQILGKPYLNKISKKILASFFEVFEKFTCNRFDYIITATPSISLKFIKINKNTCNINNYPMLDELHNSTNWDHKAKEVAYVGSIAKIRGIEEVVKSLNYTKNIRLNLVGEFGEELTEKKIKSLKAWSLVNELGFLNRKEVNKILAKSCVGIVTFLPAPNHVDAQPNKMFEYMSSGIPIVTSNFELWEQIVLGNECGLCVNPLDSEAIAKAIQYLVDHPSIAEKMGKNGRDAIEQKYNWKIEETKLLQIYAKLS
jgi:glycosyltransferase involved in cell wall biosynthesis